MITSVLAPEDVFLIPSNELQRDTLVIVIGGQVFLFNEISNAQRDFWQHMTTPECCYVLGYSDATWGLDIFNAGGRIGKWQRSNKRDSWARYDAEGLPEFEDNNDDDFVYDPAKENA